MDDKHQEKTPQKALTDFLDCWKKRSFKKMIEFCQITWRSEHEEKGTNIKELFKESFFGFKELIYFEIKNIQMHGVFADIEATMKYKFLGKTFTKKIKPRIICETGPYQPSKEGTWGVNPISVLREY